MVSDMQKIRRGTLFPLCIKTAWAHSDTACAQAVGFLYDLRSLQVVPARAVPVFRQLRRCCPIHTEEACRPAKNNLIQKPSADMTSSYRKRRIFSRGKIKFSGHFSSGRAGSTIREASIRSATDWGLEIIV